MSSTRPKLILDEDSFQGLLAAAFTIQQYNEREGGIDGALSAELNATLGLSLASKNGSRAPSALASAPASAPAAAPALYKNDGMRNIASPSAKPALSFCPQCGGPLIEGGIPCPVCDTEVFRPGERLQRTWATMWSISQEQGLPAGLGPSLKANVAEAQGAGDADSLVDGAPRELAALADSEGLRILPATDAAPLAESALPRVKVRFRRADMYLGVAVVVALFALLWPAASAGGNELSSWDRMLIAMGIAEAPTQAAEVHYSGDPNIKVWVDTRAALYYCPGDDLYGKSSGGYYTTQHDAQMDRFEPALRRACVP